MLNILVVDDDADTRGALRSLLSEAGHHVSLASDGAQALAECSNRDFDLLIADVKLPKIDGKTLFLRVMQQSPQTEAILITAFGCVADAVEAVREGAADYLSKPFDVADLMAQVDKIAAKKSMQQDVVNARALSSRFGAAPRNNTTLSQMILGQSPIIVRHRNRIETLAASDAPVLITGESGTGKELVARALHERGARHAKPFVAVNCAAFPETLLEAELFGVERGAFTGAEKRRDGRFQSAAGGTLLLDEVAEIPLPVQAKLLRVLQEGTVEPLGSNQSIHVDVRIVSATHRNLKEWTKEGRFREDLYYRLDVLDIEVPALRDRYGDLPLLVQHFLRKFSPVGKAVPSISPRAWAILSHHTWPGNVRELSHALEHAVVLSSGNQIEVEHIPVAIRGEAHDDVSAGSQIRPLSESMKEFEGEYIKTALAQAGGKRGKAAEMLGICRKNLWEKMCQHKVLDAQTAENSGIVDPDARMGSAHTP